MFYTHSSYCASCEVAEDFNLDEYLTALTDFIGNHIEDLPNDLQDAFGDYDHEDTMKSLSNYIRLSGGKLLVEFASEESNGDVGVWDWLCDQIRQDVMTSPFMTMNYATDDSHSGMECGISYYLKDGRFIGSDDVFGILEQYIKMSA